MRACFIIIGSILLLSCAETTIKDPLQLKNRLSGKWKADAFDGELHESWELQTNGCMQQEGFYIQHKTDTNYSAITRIEKINESIILFSVIKNSNPKIFKAVRQNDSEIVFENTDYKNPFKVTYKFKDANTYDRTITGYENDRLVTYTFNFRKIDP